MKKAKVLSGKFSAIPVQSIIPTLNMQLYDCGGIGSPNPQIYGQGRTQASHVKGKGNVVARHEGIWVVRSKLYLRCRSPQYSLKINMCGPFRNNLDTLSIRRMSSSLQPSQRYGLHKCIRLWTSPSLEEFE